MLLELTQMAGVTGPLMSMSATGSIGRTLTFARWKQTAVTKAHSSPSNPNTAAQQSARTVWAFLNELYRALPQSARSSWQRGALSTNAGATNLWLKRNQTNMYHAANLDALIETAPGQNAPSEPIPTCTPGANTLRIQSPGPTLPDGWQVTYQYADLIPDIDPHAYTPPIAPTETSGPQLNPLDWTFTSLISGQTYQVRTYSLLSTGQAKPIWTTAAATQGTPS